jgi:hypothetical protein
MADPPKFLLPAGAQMIMKKKEEEPVGHRGKKGKKKQGGQNGKDLDCRYSANSALYKMIRKGKN